MTADIGALITALSTASEDAEEHGFGTASVKHRDIASAVRVIEDSQAKLQEIAETIASGGINLAAFGDPDFTQMAVPIEDIKDVLDGGEYPITPVFFDAYSDILTERNQLVEEIRLLRAVGADAEPHLVHNLDELLALPDETVLRSVGTVVVELGTVSWGERFLHSTHGQPASPESYADSHYPFTVIYLPALETTTGA